MADAKYPDDWELKAAFMRDRGIGHAEWSHTNELLVCTTGAPPVEPLHDDNSAKQPTADELERRMRDEHRRVALAASGGPRRRLSAHTD